MLGVTIQINERLLAFYEIRRMKPVDRQPSQSTLCLYHVFDEEGHDVLGHPVYHQYGRGAGALVYKVLGKINRLKRRKA
jgi:hypothetical protein